MMGQTVLIWLVLIINYYCDCCYELFLMTAPKYICYTAYRSEQENFLVSNNLQCSLLGLYIIKLYQQSAGSTRYNMPKGRAGKELGFATEFRLLVQ